ncbi:MAG: ABC transporter permease, partial [Propionibacterium sp.]|nr:ABC transporter permease [Propionibacterium sp.]
TLVASRMFGPVLASSAEGFWLMESPMDRRRLLGGRFVVSVLLAGVLVAVFAGLVAALTGSSLVNVGIWAGSAGLAAAGLTALAGLEQTFDRRALIVAVQWVTGLAAAATLGLLVAAAAGWLSIEASVDVDFVILGGAVGLVLLVLAGIWAFTRLREIRRARLTSGGSLLNSLQGAAFALEFALIRDILVEAKQREKGHVNPTRGSGRGTTALVMRDVQRLMRNPLSVVVFIGTIIVPYAVTALGLQALNVAISGIVVMAALIPFMNSLRVLSRTKGLARLFPFSPTKLRQATMVVPALLALVWVVGAFPAFAGLTGEEPVPFFEAASTAVVAGLGGFLGAVRWVSAKPASYSGPLVATGTGAMPPGLMFSMIRGFDMIALTTLPLLFGLPAWVSIVIGAIAFGFLSSGLDQQTLMEQSQEQREELDREKARARGEGPAKQKIKVQRGQSGGQRRR